MGGFTNKYITFQPKQDLIWLIAYMFCLRASLGFLLIGDTVCQRRLARGAGW